jgi:hypothetical protein
MTSHEIARRILALPDTTINIEERSGNHVAVDTVRYEKNVSGVEGCDRIVLQVLR